MKTLIAMIATLLLATQAHADAKGLQTCGSFDFVAIKINRDHRVGPTPLFEAQSTMKLSNEEDANLNFSHLDSELQWRIEWDDGFRSIDKNDIEKLFRPLIENMEDGNDKSKLLSWLEREIKKDDFRFEPRNAQITQTSLSSFNSYTLDQEDNEELLISFRFDNCGLNQ